MGIKYKSGLFTSALTANDIQQQIASLLAQIAQLQEQLKQLQMPAPVTPPVSRICPILNRTLARGASGSDVTSLQAYLGVSQTGYFGPLTEQAVQQLQVQEGVVSSGSAATTGYGSVGARTRAVFARRCGTVVSPPQPQPPIACTAVYPICGVGYHVGGYCNNQCLPDTTSAGAPTISGLDAPTSLNVGQTGTWTVHASVPGGGQVSYSIVWGDENYLPLASNAASAVAVNTSGSFTHAYSKAGTYSPTFTVSNSSGSAQTSASVVVSGVTPTNATFSASPTSGAMPLTVVFVVRDKPFAAVAGAATDSSCIGPYVGDLDFGDGSQTERIFGTKCESSHDIVKTHTYTSAGTYTAKLTKMVYNSCSIGQDCAAWYSREEVVGTVTITVTGSQSTTFSASPTSGSAPLAVDFYAPTDSFDYRIDFGDGSDLDQYWGPNSLAICRVRVGVPGCISASHTYASAGTYTAKLSRVPGPTEANCAGVDCWVVGKVTITVTAPVSASCTTPWGNLTVQNGQAVISSPYFNNGACVYSGVAHPQPWNDATGQARHVCQNGTWVTRGTCDDGGTSCLGSWNACATTEYVP